MLKSKVLVTFRIVSELTARVVAELLIQLSSVSDGFRIHISSNYNLCLFKNGSFYDIDRGADPDIYIAKLADFYDRESLTKMINEVY